MEEEMEKKTDNTISLDTIMPSLLPFVRLMLSDDAIANAIRVPKGYGTLRRNCYSGVKNWEAIQNLIQASQETWQGISFDYPEITELFKRYSNK
jgi:hypothetical protein